MRHSHRLIHFVGQFMRLPRWEAFRVVLMQERLGVAMRQLKAVYERGSYGEGCVMTALTSDGSRRVAKPCSRTVDL